MAVSTEHTKDILMGDGVNRKFPFTFQVIDKKQIRCLKVLASGEEIELLNTEFDVSLNNSGANGGEVTFPLLGEPLEEGVKLIIHRQTAIKQDYTPPNGQVFDAVAVKTEIDRLTMQNQEQEENIERAVKTSMGSDVKPEEYLDNVNEMLANARILQEEAIEVSAKNIEEASAQVEIAKEMAESATTSATSSALSLKEATTQADRAEAEAEKAATSAGEAKESAVNSLYYIRKIGNTSSIVLEDGKTSYPLVISVASSITFDASGIAKSGEIVFHMDIKLSALVPVDFTSANIFSWLNDITPDFSDISKHILLGFMSIDGGNTWLGSVEGYYNVSA